MHPGDVAGHIAMNREGERGICNGHFSGNNPPFGSMVSFSYDEIHITAY